MSIESTPSFLPYGRQMVDEEDIRAVVEVLRSDWLTTGPAVDRLEEALARRVGAAHACVLNSGTSALHAAYAAAGIGPGRTLVTSPLTFVATANAAAYLGAKVRFVDVSADTGNLDPEALSHALDSEVQAVTAIDFAGHPADYPAIRARTADRGVHVLADAAHSFGAALDGTPVGKLADMSAISMHPLKPFTTGEGGAVLSDRQPWHAHCARFRSHGIERDPSRLQDPHGPWSYEMCEIGFNYRLTDLQCALGLSQLRRLDWFIERRQAIARRYLEAFAGLDALSLPACRPGVQHGWHLFVVRVAGNPSMRRPFFERLRTLGLGVQVHYMPVHLHPWWKAQGFREGMFPVAEDFYQRSVSLPIYPAMSDADVESVIERVTRAVREVLD